MVFRFYLSKSGLSFSFIFPTPQPRLKVGGMRVLRFSYCSYFYSISSLNLFVFCGLKHIKKRIYGTNYFKQNFIGHRAVTRICNRS